MPLIVHELLAYQADIICLQEVDKSIFHRFLYPVLQFCGYEGYYSGKGEEQSEGCAMFYALNTFEKVPEQFQNTFLIRHVMPNVTADATDNNDEEWPSTQAILQLFRDRPDLDELVHTTLGHVFQLIRLQPRRAIVDDDNHVDTDVNDDDETKKIVKSRAAVRRPPPPIWVCNTHLFFHPQASHIRTLQMYAICRHLGKTLAATSKQDDEDSSSWSSSGVILCGDFNANLTDPPGRLVVQRQVPSNAKYLKLDLNRFTWKTRNHPRRRGTGLSPMLLDTDFPELILPSESISFPTMRSALSEAAPVTHFIPGFAGTLDHILVGSSGKDADADTDADADGDAAVLQPYRHAPLPSRRALGRHTAMPSQHLPSDHMSLVVDLKLRTITTPAADTGGMVPSPDGE
jgi:2',5'-phosphodiesterase